MLCVCQHHLASGKAVEFRPFVPAETPRACALIGLHLMAAESASGSSGSQSPDSGMATRKALTGTATLSQGTSSAELCKHNVESLPLKVIGQNWSGENIALFLQDWELARVALSCHLALDMLCQEMHEEW